MIGYRYVDRQQKKEFVVVTEDVKEKLEEWQRNLAEFWENMEELLHLIL